LTFIETFWAFCSAKSFIKFPYLNVHCDAQLSYHVAFAVCDAVKTVKYAGHRNMENMSTSGAWNEPSDNAGLTAWIEHAHLGSRQMTLMKSKQSRYPRKLSRKKEAT